MPNAPRSSRPQELLTGLVGFVAFEVVVYWALRWSLTALLGSPDADSTVVTSWVRLMAFLLLHIVALVAAQLAVSNWLPRRYRGQVQGWFYAGLLLGLALSVTLY